MHVGLCMSVVSVCTHAQVCGCVYEREKEEEKERLLYVFPSGFVLFSSLKRALWKARALNISHSHYHYSSTSLSQQLWLDTPIIFDCRETAVSNL